MHVAFESSDERDGGPEEPYAAHDPGGEYDAPAPNGRLEAADALALYEEYLKELDKVPTLRDPVLPETSGQQLNLEEKIREIVRDELAKALGESSKRTTRSRKRRKR